MLSTFVLSFREVFEAALVIAIIITYLGQIDKKNLSKFVIYGAVTGLIVSFIGGFIGFNEAKEMGESGEEIFEAVMRIVAAGLITYFVVWIGNQNRNMTQNIKEQVNKSSTAFGLFLLAFISVLREGIELVIFTLTNISNNASNLAMGIVLGTLSAIILTYIIFKSTVKLNIKMIFKALGVVLIFLGAEMFGEGMLKLFELSGEFYEVLFIAIYIIPMAYLFFKDDLKRFFGKETI